MSSCSFCNAKLKTSEGYDVKGVVIDQNPGIIKLTDVLLDLYFCELDVTKICGECLEFISKQFKFKQKLRENMKMPQSSLIAQISKFLSRAKETAQVTEFSDVLSIFPEHRKQMVDSMMKMMPHVAIAKSAIKSNLKIVDVLQSPEVKSEKTVQRKSVTFEPSTNFKNALTSSSDNSDTDSDYGAKSPKKRKKQKSPVRSKKSTFQASVKEEPTEVTEPKVYKGPQQPRERADDRRNSTGLKLKLSKDQSSWLNVAISETQTSELNHYLCKFCFKTLKSKLAIRYHYINRHLLKNLTNKQVWVAQKIKEGHFKIKQEDGTIVDQWGCTECKKIFNNHPGLRYHLGKHLRDDCDEVFSVIEED